GILGFGLVMQGTLDEAVDEARQAADLNPSDPLLLNFLAYALTISGHPPEQSIALIERAQRLSPHDPSEFLFYETLATAYFNAGRYADGVAAARRLISLRPTYLPGYFYGAMNASALDRRDEASELLRQARQLQPELSIAVFRSTMGGLAPDVDQRMTA